MRAKHRHTDLIIVAVALASTSCGEGRSPQCSGYTLALATCLSAAQVEYTADDLSATACADHTEPPYPAYFACVAEVLHEADCSTTEGIRAASAGAAHCQTLLSGADIDENL
jgi:hypothetical protein